MSGQVGMARVGTLLPAPEAGRESQTWVEWLRDRVDPKWRPDEWDEKSLTWTPNPANPGTAFGTCARPGCQERSIYSGPRGICESCNSEKRRKGWNVDRLLSTPLTESRPSLEFVPRCLVVADGVQCGFDAVCRGLCVNHYGTYKPLMESVSVEQYVKGGFTKSGRKLVALSRVACTNPFCNRSAKRPRGQGANLCHYCQQNSNRSIKIGESKDFADWVARFAEPAKPFGTVLLGLVPYEAARLEILLGMQEFDRERHGRLYPLDIQRITRAVRTEQRETLVGAAEWLVQIAGVTSNARSFARLVGHTIDQANRRFIGEDPTDAMILHLEDLNLRRTASSPHTQRRPEPMDLSRIEQEWLREAFRSWVLTTRDSKHRTKRLFATTVEASRALAKRRDGGHNPEALGVADMTAVVDAIHTFATRDGATSPDRNYVRRLVGDWWVLVEHARRFGLWEAMRPEFARDPVLHKNRGTSKTRHEDTDKALPDAFVRHIRNNIHCLTGETAPMRVCLLAVLIDTGRRPNEVASLKRDCLARDVDGGWILTYDNHKAGRLNRRLAIRTETAEAIQSWQQQLDQAGTESRWLFPSPRYTAAKRDKHISPSTFAPILTDLTAALPPIDGPILNSDGDHVEIDVDAISLSAYDFRHAYAQRHADAGVPLDTLMDLMDHQNAETTLGYYRVNAKRLREAADLVAPLTRNAKGQTVGLAPGRRALATVAVPWGGCSEPSNVAAGGTNCPIRFQCASCTFYRPDPSYIPNIEQHIASLKVNAAAARRMGAAPHVIENFEGQIGEYKDVLSQMRESLENLPDDERKAVDMASAVLRRARIAASEGRALPLEVAPVKASESASTSTGADDL